MHKKLSVLYFIFILFLAFVIPNLTIASSDTSGVINITNISDNITLKFASNEQLIPGSSQSKNFVINNHHNFNTQLSKITLKNLILSKDHKLLSNTNSEYIEFINNTYFKLKYKDIIIFEGLFKDLFAGGYTYIPNKKLLFLSGSGDNFSVELSMTPKANNETQNMKATFDILYLFTCYNQPPQIESPSPVELKTKTKKPPITKSKPVKQLVEPMPKPEVEEIKKIEKQQEEIIIIDEEIPKMGVFFDNYIIVSISIALSGIGLYLLCFSNKKKKV